MYIFTWDFLDLDTCLDYRFYNICCLVEKDRYLSKQKSGNRRWIMMASQILKLLQTYNKMKDRVCLGRNLSSQRSVMCNSIATTILNFELALAAWPSQPKIKNWFFLITLTDGPSVKGR